MTNTEIKSKSLTSNNYIITDKGPITVDTYINIASNREILTPQLYRGDEIRTLLNTLRILLITDEYTPSKEFYRKFFKLDKFDDLQNVKYEDAKYKDKIHLKQEFKNKNQDKPKLKKASYPKET